MIRSFRFLLVFLFLGGSLFSQFEHSVSATPQQRTLKILMLVGQFPSLSQTFVINQIIGLIDRGHDVRIYAIDGESDTPVINNDVKTYNLMDRVYFSKPPIDLESYDIIIGQFGMLGLKAVDLKRKHKNAHAKVVTFFRGYDISSWLVGRPHAYDRLFEQGDLFLAECDFFRKRLYSLGAAPERTGVHFSAIQTSRFKCFARTPGENGAVKVLTVSRLIEKKGIEDALEAMSHVMRRFPHVSYTIVGDGRLKGELMQLARKLGIAHRVTFAGSKTPIEVAQYMCSSHIFVLPCVVAANGDIDGVPTVLKEAMACGMPVVSTYVSGIPEIVEDGKSGYLVQPHDVQGLSNKLLSLVEHPEQWGPMGLSGREFIQNYCDSDKLNDELERMLLELTQ